MRSELLTKSPLLGLPLFALFLFLGIFGFVLVATMRRKAAAYDPLARLALDDGSPAEDARPGWGDATTNDQPAALALRGRYDGGES